MSGLNDEILDVAVTYQGVSLRLAVTRIDETTFRLEDSVLFAEDELEAGDIVTGSLEGDRLTINERVRRTPLVRSDFMLPRALVASPDLEELKNSIIESGGMWEQIAGGTFVVHLPRDAIVDVGAELDKIAKAAES